MDLSSKTVQRIYMNFIWAVVYNLIGVPLAAGALVHFGELVQRAARKRYTRTDEEVLIYW